MDDCVGVGSKEELDALANGIDAKYRITGLGEARWMLGMLVKRPRYPDHLYFSRSVPCRCDSCHGASFTWGAPVRGRLSPLQDEKGEMSTESLWERLHGSRDAWAHKAPLATEDDATNDDDERQKWARSSAHPQLYRTPIQV